MKDLPDFERKQTIGAYLAGAGMTKTVTLLAVLRANF
jgi:hypothetical protein